MKFPILIAFFVFSFAAHALVIRANSEDVGCKAEVDRFGVLLLDIQIKSKTVGQYILAHGEPVNSPIANAALAYCDSITTQATQEGRMVVIDTDANDVQRAITVEDDECRDQSRSTKIQN